MPQNYLNDKFNMVIMCDKFSLGSAIKLTKFLCDKYIVKLFK